MTASTRFLAGVAVSALMAGQAWADVTPDEVWKAWVDYSAAMGQQLQEGARNQQGDTLVLTNVIARNTGADEKVHAEVAIPQISLRDMGDGRVEVTMSETTDIRSTIEVEDGKTHDVTGKMVQSGLTTIVSGTPEAMDYEIKADRVSYNMAVPQPEPEPMDMTVDMAVNGLSGAYKTLTDTDKVTTTGEMRADSAEFRLGGKDPATPDNGMTITWNGTPAEMTYTSTLPGGVSMTNMSDALKAGAVMDAAIKLGAMRYDMAVRSTGDGDVSYAGSDEGGDLQMSFADGGITYKGEARGSKGTVSGAQMPFPIDFAIEKSAGLLTMPVVKSDNLAPYRYMAELKGMTVSDSLWAMLDPGQQLPRDPISLLVDLDGMMKMPVDLMDPDSMQDAEHLDVNPFAGGNVNINAVSLSAVGASVTATGKLDIPEQPAPAEGTDPAADPMAMGPMPVGTIDARGTGINALMDKLVAMGLVPEDQMMGARMMLALFTKADGEDDLTSQLEFREDGSIYANGQRIK